MTVPALSRVTLVASSPCGGDGGSMTMSNVTRSPTRRSGGAGVAITTATTTTAPRRNNIAFIASSLLVEVGRSVTPTPLPPAGRQRRRAQCLHVRALQGQQGRHQIVQRAARGLVREPAVAEVRRLQVHARRRHQGAEPA